MVDCKAIFGGKRITLMGLGLLGRGVGDAEMLAESGAQLIVTDQKTAEELAPSVERLKKYPNVEFHLGGHRLEDFTSCDLVVKGAGVPLESPEIAAAKEAGVEVAMSTALFAKYADKAGATIVGITGTRGKSTVTHLIHHAVKNAGYRAFLGGNIRGVSTLAYLCDIQPGDIAVLELDSWQLQGFADLKISPHVAVFTNLMQDHLNYYHGDMERYFWDKMNIFRFQRAGDTLVAGAQVKDRIAVTNPVIPPQTPPPLPNDWTLQLLGMHNRENASLAAGALRALGLTEEQIRSGIESFEPVRGRLQLVKEAGGVKIYNDNNSTTPEATLAALESLPAEQTILIMGGADKNLSLEQLAVAMRRCKSVLLLAGSGTDRLKQMIGDAPTFNSVDDALMAAQKLAAPGDSILFSPGFASFGLFQNEYDRGDRFMSAVETLA